jgi:hypothetical protein
MGTFGSVKLPAGMRGVAVFIVMAVTAAAAGFSQCEFDWKPGGGLFSIFLKNTNQFE